MQEPKETWINTKLTEKETVTLNQAKEKTGIKNTVDLIRHLITKCARGE